MGSRKQKWLAAILIAMLAITATTGAVYAYLSATTDSVENTFTAAPTHTIDIRETFPTGVTNPTKENIKVDVGNPGYAVYVRVAIVVTWQNAANEVYGQAPVEDTDYKIELDNSNWFEGSDGFYYYSQMVAYDGENDGTKVTEALIDQCYQTAPAPADGYTLHVEIIAQTIQAKGSTDDDDIPAVTDAWEVVKVVDGQLKPKT